MGRIDPKELLGLFRADLTLEGGIRCDPAVVHKFCGATCSYGKKLVSRCVYLNILKNTSPEALELYLSQKGWQTLNTWLKDAKEDNNQPFVQELVDLLILCPVTVDRLRVTDTAKLVKALRKEGNTAGVIDRANRLYDKWLNVIGASHASSAPAAAAADAAAAALASEAGVSGGASKAKKAKVRKGSVDGNDSSSNSSDVVMNGSGAAAGGRGVGAAGTTTAAAAAASGVLTTSSGNKVRQAGGATTITSTIAAATGAGSVPDTNAHAANNLITITPSDAFMASLAPVIEVPKRKKKPTHESESANKKTKTTTPVPDGNAATAADAAASGPDPEDLLSSIIEQDMSVDVPVPDPVSRSLSDVPVTPTTLPVTSPTAAFCMTGGPLNPMISTPTSSRVSNPNFGTPPSFSSPSSSSCLMTPGPDKSYPRGCLHYSSSGKKKSVRWLPDESMTRIKYFETAVDERVNVWRQSLQQNNTQNENRLAEGQAFKDRSNGDAGADAAATASPKFTWAPLQVIELPEPPSVVRGSGSQEKEIERRRQLTILADIYINKDMIPDAPSEPDPLITSVSLPEQKAIPLEDPTGGNVLTDHSKTPLPPPRNNPLFGETFLQPHQMALDHSIHHPSAAAHLPHVIGGPAAAAANANGPLFQSSYVEAQAQRPFVKSHLGPAHVNGGGGGRGALGPNHAANSKNNHHNSGVVGVGGGGNKPFLADLRNSKGQKVCGFFYNSGNCYRNNCHFLHTREDVTDWGGNNFNSMQKFKQTA